MKKLFTLFLLAFLPLVASAENDELKGKCGDNLTWTVNSSTGILTISGFGAMTNYDDYYEVPWKDIDYLSIIIEQGVTSIGSYAFCKNYTDISFLTSVTIANSVTSIGEMAFFGCKELPSITIPNSVTIIEKDAFAHCEGLTSVSIGNGVTSIGVSAFYGCSGLTSVTIPNSVTDIGEQAFYGCSSLSSISIGNNVTNIGENAFFGCCLNSVTIPNSMTSIGQGAFSGSGLHAISIANSVTSIGDHAFSNCIDLTSITIPNSVTSIGEGVFGGCDGLTSITIGSSVTSIGYDVFSDCGALTSIIVNEGNPKYDSRNNCNAIINTELNTLIAGCKNTLIPNSVTSIGDHAFLNCYCWSDGTGLTSITIPNSVTSIGSCAFLNCSGLTSITIPSSVTSIGERAFDSCSGLTSVTIFSNLTSIGNNAFSFCSKLTDIYCYAKDVPPTGFSTFYSANISNATLHVPAGCVETYQAVEPWNQFKEIVEIEGTGEEHIVITSAKQVPYYSDKNLDFTDKPELKAYVATGYDKATGTIWLTRVKQVPAKTGFLLLGDPGDYVISTIEGVSDVYYKNMFKGTLTGTTLYTTDGDYTNYYLSKGDAGVGFYKVTKEEGVKVGANRCYLPILTEIPANGSTGDTEVIKVSAAKQVPYFTSKNLDFSSLDAQGVKAYTATGYNYSTGVIWLTRVKKVPAKTGILVMADVEGDYNVPTATVQSVYENMFVGSETTQTIYTNEEIGGVDYVNYYLSKGDAGVGFYKVTNEDGVKMGANRCYLPIPKRDAASGARGKNGESAFCKMVLSDESNDDVIAIPLFTDGTTGIDIQSSIFNDQSNEVYYNLQGQRVDNPTKGIFIKNGKKVVIK